MNQIVLTHVTKTFGQKLALDDLSLSLEKGKIYGLLGRNGAGKSTLLRLLSGRLQPSTGRIIYEGAGNRPLQGIYHTEPLTMLPQMRLDDVFKYTAAFHPAFDLEDAKADAQDFGLDLRAKRKQLSTGQLSALHAVLALNTHRDFILLDEPTLGFDVVSREIFYDRVLKAYNRDQATIVLSTHLIDEVAPLLEDVLLIDHGRLLLQASLDGLLTSHFMLQGPTKTLEQIAIECSIIHRHVQGDYSSLVCQGQTIPTPLPYGVSQSPVRLQDLFIALTQASKGDHPHA